MTLAVGLDVGNATTEAVLADVVRGEIEVLAHDRVSTRGPKGSPSSLDAAAALVRRLERRSGRPVELVAIAPLRPVHTAAVTVDEPDAGTGRLSLVRAGAATAAGAGFGVGRAVRLGAAAAPGDGDVVAVVPRGTGYHAAVPLLRALHEAASLVAVVLGDDEAVLVANRLGLGIPVVDDVDVERVLRAERVAVEVQPPGQPLRALTDPLRMTAELGLRPGERGDAARLAAALGDCANAVVVVDTAAAVGYSPRGWVELADDRTTFPRAHAVIRSSPPGAAVAYGLDAGGAGHVVDDLFTVDLADIADTVGARRGVLGSRSMALSALHGNPPVEASHQLDELLHASVRTVGSEAAAARAGGLTTPGADETTTVVDLGGGTIDVVGASAAVVLAGAGDLLTVSTAALLGVTRAAAEWVKRGPGYRVESPQVLLGEDGSRRFLDRAVTGDAVGALVVDAAMGLLPFDRVHAPSEWRALRRRLKSDVLGGNLARAMQCMSAPPTSVVVVGGPAGDDEVLGCVASALSDGTPVGRGNAGGSLGHRYVVAYGLLRLLVSGRSGAW